MPVSSNRNAGTSIHSTQSSRRAKVGLIVPSLNTTTEPEFATLAPPGVTFHATRVYMEQTTTSDLQAMNAEVEAASRLIASIDPDVVAYACTSGTFVAGPSGLQSLTDTIASVAGCPVVTTSGAMVEALRHLGVRRLALATPYPEDITHAEEIFLAESGFQIVSTNWLGLSGAAIRKAPLDAIRSLVRSVDRTSADAIFVSCTDFRALELVDELERETHKPVLTSNQVTLWGVLSALRIKHAGRGYGKLLSE